MDINLAKAWDITQGSPNVIVAVIDEGSIRIDHEDLSSRIFINPNEVPGDGIDNDHNGFVDDVNGYDFTGSGAAASHATLIAGVIAAATGNAKGGTGVAPNVRILPIAAHYSNPSEMVPAISYAKAMGAKIVNLSQGSNVFDQSVFTAIQNSGLLFTISAGNRGTGAYGFPASFDLPNIISVASVENAGRLALTSSYGEPHVDIGAPGWNIYGPSAQSTSSYDYESGTSFAAPHVAGVAALVMSQFPSLTVADVVNRILSTGTKLDSLSGMVKSGAMIDAYAALAGVSPITLNASSIPGRISLSWNAQAGATRYDVEVDGALVANGTATSYQHSGLVTDSAHVYRVRAAFGSSLGPWSYRWIKRAGAAPVQASLSVGTAHSYSNNTTKDYFLPAKNAISMRVHFAKIDVAITADDPSHDCVFYTPSEQEGVDQCDSNYVLRGKYLSGLWTRFGRVPFNVHFESDAALTAYGFAIDKIEYFTGIPEQPSAPFAFATSATSISVSLLPASGAEKVNVYRSLTSNGSYSKVATVTVANNGSVPNYVNTGLSSGTTYYYKSSNTNGLGESQLSDFAAATP